MSEKEVEKHLKSYLENRGQAVAAKDLVGALQIQTGSASVAKMALLRLANRSEVRVRPDLTVELVRD